MENIFSGKNIHIVGITGSEGSAILDYIANQNPLSIVGHDFTRKELLEKNFKTWHKGIDEITKEQLWQKFKNKIKKIILNTYENYLKGIENADVIFVPQSWRLYPQNVTLFSLNRKNFYSLTRLYLEFTKAITIAVTGTVGKGSTANLIFNILKENLPVDRTVFFAGNETWRPQAGFILDELRQKDYLVLEISHRQLLDGIKKGPKIAVFINIYPNHLDEVTYDEYKETKLSLLKAQSAKDIAILNYNFPDLRNITPQLQSKVIFFHAKSHFEENVEAAKTVANVLGIPSKKIEASLKNIKSLPGRLELIKEIDGIKIYDDIKSTTPWATLAALERLGRNTILIWGGGEKGIDFSEFLVILPQKTKYAIKLQADLENALLKAYISAQKGDNILISPAAAFFYTKFIKGKKSIRKIITSLPPKEKV